MGDTLNQGDNGPEEGEENWHVPLDANFTDFDVDIELRDEESNLDGEGDYEFASTVKGTRDGHDNEEVVRGQSRKPTHDAGSAVADGGTVEEDR
ncbi:MAG: hypothetical protein V5A55_04725 [Halovenus sp.]